MRYSASCAVALVALATMVAAVPTSSRPVGRQPDGSAVTPAGQRVRPAGRQLGFAGRAAAAAVRPDGRTAAVLSATDAAVSIVDLSTWRVVQRVSDQGRASNAGIAYSHDGRRLFASYDGGRVVRFDVTTTGRLRRAAAFRLPRWQDESEITAGLAVSPDDRLVYVALNRSNRLGVLDAATGRVLARVPVGSAPFAVALAGGVAVVANQGGRAARPGDRTNDSAGTPVVSDGSTGSAAGGTVSLVDLTTLRVRRQTRVGLHPVDVAVRGGYAFVANANSDSVSVVDVAGGRVVSTIPVRPFAGAPFGSSVNAVATYGDDRVVVSLGRSNALAVLRWTSPANAAHLDGMVPTGWYPTDVAVDGHHHRLLVVNSRGMGPLLTGGEWQQRGGVSLVPFPSGHDLETGARTIADNNGWVTSATELPPPRDVAPVAVPERVGEPSLIEHVFYVIKENRTYDQVLGDDLRGNGDPRNVLFGERITPNQHLLAKTYPLFDNFYATGDLSPEAHAWATQAFASDYVERGYGAFARGYPYHGGDALAYAPSGFLWENATRHGKTVRVYGELAVGRDSQGTRSDIPSLDAVLDRSYPPFDMTVRDTTRMDLLLDDVRTRIAQGTVPNLSIVQLPLDHTRGASADLPTAEADVADNDLALGQLIQALSTSSIWAKTAVLVFEDDAQKGLDHVDGHRTTAFVASPYAQRGVVDSAFYTQLDMIRTIEQILGLPPMNQMDLVAQPMFGAFTDTAVLTPFYAVPPIVGETRNPPLSSLTGLAREWAEASAAIDFTIPDAAPEALLNRAIWYAVRGFVPYPGDTRVLSPDEVTDE